MRLVPLTIALLYFAITGCAPVDRIVEFPDGNLERAIREAIEKPEGEIRESEMKWIRELSGASPEFS